LLLRILMGACPYRGKEEVVGVFVRFRAPGA
jgi:hypothetical protein